MSSRREFLLAAATVTAAAALPANAKPTRPEVKMSLSTYKIPNTDLVVSRLAYGVAGFGGGYPPDKSPLSAQAIVDAARLVYTAYENGITLFDNADVYGYGKAETAMGAVLGQSPGLRHKIVIQSKCGIYVSYPFENPPLTDPHRFDFSYQHIISAVEGSLQRLGTDHLDILLLHRPDPLVEPQEVAKAFDELHRAGKARYFGVSNHTAAQIELLKKEVRQPLVVNQVALSLVRPDLITEGLDFNRQGDSRLNKSYTSAAGALDYCRLHDIQVQAWAPVGGLKASPEAVPAIKQTMQLLTELGSKKNASPYAVALAWLLRHPAGILPITGASKLEHLIENCAADRITLSREEWYMLLLAATGLPPVKML